MSAVQLLLFLIAVPVLAGPVPEDVDARLRKAKTTYEQRITESIASIHRRLEMKENQARSKGDKKLVDQIKKEKEAVDESLAVPASVDVESDLSEIRRARATLLKEYDLAIKECLKGKADEEANSYEVQKNDFIREFLKTHRGIAGSLGTRWIHPGGAFEETAEGNWIETFKNDPQRRNQLPFAKRMNDCVMLQTTRRATTVWLYSDRCVVKLDKAEPRVFYEGEWER